ncbi:MAG: CHRD domain-containing protein [Ilumatobacteraceae bacterium]
MNRLNARRTTMAGIGVAVAGLAMMATLTTSAASFGGRPLSADLNGAAEVPGPGDPDGTGRAEIRVRAARGEVCYELTVKNITPATWAAIHFAPAGAVGPDVVYFIPPAPEIVLSTGEVIGGNTSGCTFVDPALAKDIVKHPDQYYVNVQNAAFLAGAVRGQLGR